MQGVPFQFQRSGFCHKGLFWQFYCDGTNIVYKTSKDGSTWENPATIGAATVGNYFSLWFDGTYVHYVRFVDDYTLRYRRGIPNRDSTVTWSAAEQTVYAGTAGGFHYFPSVSVDSGGHAWIGTCQSDGVNEYPYVWRNDNLDGTWSTTAAFPYLLKNLSGAWTVQPVPLTLEKVYVIYCNHTTQYGKLYNAGWGAEETDLADYNIQNEYYFSAVNEGDDVHFAYNRQTTYQIRYNKRTYGTGWAAADVLVQDSMENATIPALSVDRTYKLRCFWTKISTDHIYYKERVFGTWDTDATDWKDESTDDIQTGVLLCGFYKACSGYTGLMYLTKLASPWNVKFAFLPAYRGDNSELQAVMNVFRRAVRGNPNFEVTWSALFLGNRDAVTGWYQKSYEETAIDMVIVQKEYQGVALSLGYYVSLDALGFTIEPVEACDLITDAFSRTWEVKAAKPIVVGNIVKYFVCDLKELPFSG